LWGDCCESRLSSGHFAPVKGWGDLGCEPGGASLRNEDFLASPRPVILSAAKNLRWLAMRRRSFAATSRDSDSSGGRPHPCPRQKNLPHLAIWERFGWHVPEERRAWRGLLSASRRKYCQRLGATGSPVLVEYVLRPRSGDHRHSAKRPPNRLPQTRMPAQCHEDRVQSTGKMNSQLGAEAVQIGGERYPPHLPAEIWSVATMSFHHLQHVQTGVPGSFNLAAHFGDSVSLTNILCSTSAMRNRVPVLKKLADKSDQAIVGNDWTRDPENCPYCFKVRCAIKLSGSWIRHHISTHEYGVCSDQPLKELQPAIPLALRLGRVVHGV